MLWHAIFYWIALLRAQAVCRSMIWEETLPKEKKIHNATSFMFEVISFYFISIDIFKDVTLKRDSFAHQMSVWLTALHNLSLAFQWRRLAIINGNSNFLFFLFLFLFLFCFVLFCFLSCRCTRPTKGCWSDHERITGSEYLLDSWFRWKQCHSELHSGNRKR